MTTIERIQAYLEEMPSDGQYCDDAEADAYELLKIAKEELQSLWIALANQQITSQERG